MKIPVVGLDPSLRNWGVAKALLDMHTGFLEVTELILINPIDPAGKQVRQNSKDISLAQQMYEPVKEHTRGAKAVFVEVPIGSQSARAMASYGICIGVLGSLECEGVPLIQVTPLETKKALVGSVTATKLQMIKAAVDLYPEANWPRSNRGKVLNKAEHLADAVATIHAGVRTPVFKQLMNLFWMM